jgi:hypothetical protein
MIVGLRLLGILAVAAGATALPVAAAGPDLQTLLDMATAYELRFVGQFENIVAEELYVQEISVPRRKRTIKSDFLFVKYPDIVGSIVLRDVFEVDGKPVRDAAQAERMMKLFTTPGRDVISRARAIAEEGARYNLWNIGTLNNPLVAMVFLQPDYRPRFRFNLAGIEKSLGPTIRTVRFEEFRVPTVLRSGGANGDLLSRGLIWIDETDGRVVKTRLQVGPLRLPPEIVTTYRHDAELGIDVPAEMRDWYPEREGDLRGIATYGRFRRFQVKTDETIGKLGSPTSERRR